MREGRSMTEPSFAEWAMEMSQRTNRSLAGATLRLPENTDGDADAHAHADERWTAFAQAASQWGMIVMPHADASSARRSQGFAQGTDGDADSTNSPDAQEPDMSAWRDDTAAESTPPNTRADTQTDERWFDADANPMTLPDARTFTGREAMDHAATHMPVLHALMRELTGTDPSQSEDRTRVSPQDAGVPSQAQTATVSPACANASSSAYVSAARTSTEPHEAAACPQINHFAGVRIAVCLILEPKTAVLLRVLRDAGATVGVFCEPSDTDARVAEQLRREGILVEADPSWTPEQTHAGALRLLDALRPQIIIDDGASFARLAAIERPDIMAQLIGVAEETTSGVRAFQAMQDAGDLTVPVVAVNDSVLKTGFDNEHGTGESCVTTIQSILGADCFAGARVSVVGYGPVGKGFAMRIRALGAHVTVCDIDPVAALKAVFDGFEASDLTATLPQADLVVSATGVRHTITLEHMRAMHDGAALAVIGGIANEIALDDLPGFTPQVGRSRCAITVPDGPTLTLLSEGDGVNYTAGGGNPIEIMDFSFAVQVSAVNYLLEHQGELAPGLVRLGAQADHRIATLALAARGQSASAMATDSGDGNWRTTRFAEAAARAAAGSAKTKGVEG